MKAEHLTFGAKTQELVFPIPPRQENGCEPGSGTRKRTGQKAQQRRHRSGSFFSRRTKQVLACVGKFFEAFLSEESRRALDGVYRAEDLRDQSRIVGTLFKIGKAAFHAIEPFLALDHELGCRFVHRACFLPHRLEIGAGVQGFIGLAA